MFKNFTIKKLFYLVASVALVVGIVLLIKNGFDAETAVETGKEAADATAAMIGL